MSRATASIRHEATRMKAVGRALARGEHISRPRGITGRTRRSGSAAITITRPKTRRIRLRG